MHDQAPSLQLLCPVDGSPMDKVQHSGVTADRCPRCKGLWLDGLELQRVLAIKGAAKGLDPSQPAPRTAPRTARPRHLRCPRDGEPLTPTPHTAQSHVVFDSCPACRGTFFDAGEIADLGHTSLKERLKAFFA